jgi:hypothetical protein
VGAENSVVGSLTSAYALSGQTTELVAATHKQFLQQLRIVQDRLAKPLVTGHRRVFGTHRGQNSLLADRSRLLSS